MSGDGGDSGDSVDSVAFELGVNLPWLRYGGDFGANSWHPNGGVGAAGEGEPLRRRFRDAAAAGARLVRLWLFADGRAGVRFARDGVPLGLDSFVERDLSVALDLAGSEGVRLMPVLFDFLWCRRGREVSGVRLGGRRRVITEPRRRERLLSLVVGPIVERFGHHPALHSWDLFNEPEWVIRGPRVPWGLSRRTMRTFLAELIRRVREHSPRPITVGLASVRGLDLVRDLGLDVYQAHWYDRLERRAPLDTPVSGLGLERPLLLGEFPTRGSSRSVSAILAQARAAGYAGALAWSQCATDPFSSWDPAGSEMAAWAAGECRAASGTHLL